MRATQLAEFSRIVLGDRYAFRTIPMGRKNKGLHLSAVKDLQNAMVVLTKPMVSHADPEAIDHLKRNGCVILADWIDKPLKTPLADQIDVHIASSMAQEQALRDGFPDTPTRYLAHHSDPRLASWAYGPLPDLKTAYLGRRENAPELTELEDRIEWISSGTPEGFSDLVARLPAYNLHIAVRADNEVSRGIYKPFTKGFTAAACRSNVIVARSTHDAVAYLGEDYPFLIPDNSSAATMDGLDRAQEAFGGPEWHRGLEVMQDIAQRTSPAAVARQFGALLDEFSA